MTAAAVAAAVFFTVAAVAGLVWAWLRLELWVKARRARNARADAAIDTFLRERSEGARRTREVHGLTVPQLLDLVDIELDLEEDDELRACVDDLNTQFPNP